MTLEEFKEALEMTVDGDLGQAVAIEVIVGGSKQNLSGKILKLGSTNFKMAVTGGKSSVYAYSNVLSVSEGDSGESVSESSLNNSVNIIPAANPNGRVGASSSSPNVSAGVSNEKKFGGKADLQEQMEAEFEKFLKENKEAKVEFSRVKNILESAVKAHALVEKESLIRVAFLNFVGNYAGEYVVQEYSDIFMAKLKKMVEDAKTAKENLAKQKEEEEKQKRQEEFDLKEYWKKPKRKKRKGRKRQGKKGRKKLIVISAEI